MMWEDQEHIVAVEHSSVNSVGNLFSLCAVRLSVIVSCLKGGEILGLYLSGSETVSMIVGAVTTLCSVIWSTKIRVVSF